MLYIFYVWVLCMYVWVMCLCVSICTYCIACMYVLQCVPCLFMYVLYCMCCISYMYGMYVSMCYVYVCVVARVYLQLNNKYSFTNNDSIAHYLV